MGQTGFFGKKCENPPHALESPNFFQISENSYKRILRSLLDVLTYVGCELIGSWETKYVDFQPIFYSGD